MPGAEGDVGVGMFGVDFQCVIEAALDLAAKALRQRLGDRNTLAVAAQRIGVNKRATTTKLD